MNVKKEKKMAVNTLKSVKTFLTVTEHIIRPDTRQVFVIWFGLFVYPDAQGVTEALLP